MSHLPHLDYPIFTPEELRIIRQRAEAERAKAMREFWLGLFKASPTENGAAPEPAIPATTAARC